MIGKRAAPLILALASVLAGCSNAPVDNTRDTFYRDAFNSIAGAARPAPPITIRRAMFDKVESPLILVRAETTGTVGTALPAGRNGDAVTWLTANKVGLTTRNGVLIATRGLGPDLLTAESDGTIRALQSRGGQRYPRIMRHVGPDEKLRAVRYYCEMVNDGPASRIVLERRYDTVQLRESCFEVNGDREFRNVYWVGSDGTVWDSHQWVSEAAGYLTIQRLIL